MATPPSGGAADGRGVGHRLCPLQPLGKGFLTGKIDERTSFDRADIRTTIPRFTPEARRANQILVELLGRIAAASMPPPLRSRSPGFWLRGPGSCPIPGTRRLERLEENIGAVDVDLTADDLREIEDAARYPEHLERLTGR